MNPDPIADLRDLLWRRELTPDEQRRVAACLAEHPEAVSDWQVDVGLARATRRLAPVPMPSNFTARVLAEVQRETSVRRLAGTPWWQAWLAARWLPVAGALTLVAAMTLAGWRIEVSTRQATYGHEVAALRVLAEISPQVLEDFEAIRRYEESAPPVDFGLLAALQ